MARGLVACISGNFVLRVAAALAGTLLVLALAGLQDGQPQTGPIQAGLDGLKSSPTGTLVGLLAVSFYVAELCGAPIFGALSDRQGRRRFLLLGPIFGGIGVLLLLDSRLLAFLFPAVLIVVRALQGLSTAASAPATLGYLAETTVHSGSYRARVMAAYEVSTIGGLFLGSLLGAFLWDAFSGRTFLVAMALYVISILLFLKVQDPVSRVKRETSLRKQFGVLTRPSLLRFAPAWIAVNALIGAWMTHGAFQAASRNDPSQMLAGGYSGREIGFALIAVAVSFTAGMLVWSLFLSRFQLRLKGRVILAVGPFRVMTVMLVSLLGALAGSLILYLINHTQPGTIQLFLLLGLLAVAIFTLAGFTPAALVYLADLSEESAGERGVVMGAYSVFLGIGQLLGGWLGGPFSDLWRVDGLILLTSLLALVALATTIPLRAGAMGVAERPVTQQAFPEPH